ncbi:hypothetical protein ACH5RR_028735 [Cinchona calisaya]|uniref:RNA polymerase II subunit 5-mediating protein homolog n=1 Tax=Cinchona calisaya TaxID=153742 RepID=A0ABD2YT87_9GENT
MAEGLKKKGTVKSLSSLFPPEETQKASERVRDTIAERHEELQQLKSFISDNTNLVNLVRTLPNELNHQIMVPFGKAAFFPGQLIHTNEFMVLLGDGYYAERTSKQTVEILKRRGNILESQVESLKADIQDLKTEASFFENEAGRKDLVEIVEDYEEESSLQEVSKAGDSKADFASSTEAESKGTGNEGDEYARIFSRIAELEKEEEEAEKDEDDEDEENEDDIDHSVNQDSVDQESISCGVDGSKLLPVYQDGSSQDGTPASSKPRFTESSIKPPVRKENVRAPAVTKEEVFVRTSEPSTNSSKAFTGSIVEHTRNLETNPREPSVAHSSKPVSRFRMNRK